MFNCEVLLRNLQLDFNRQSLRMCVKAYVYQNYVFEILLKQLVISMCPSQKVSTKLTILQKKCLFL